MLQFIPEKLKKLAAVLPAPLYVVGGSVRDFLAGHARKQADFSDWDVCAPVLPEVAAAAAKDEHACPDGKLNELSGSTSGSKPAIVS